MASSFGELDSYLLRHCFSFCDRRTLAASSLVCRRWADVSASDSLWRDVLSREDTWQFVEFAEIHISRCRQKAGRHGSSGPVTNAPSSITGEPQSTEAASEAPCPDAHAPSPVLPWRHIMRRRHEAAPAVIIDAGSGYCKYGWSHEKEPQGTLATFLEFGSMECPLLPRITTLFKNIYAALNADPRGQPVVLTEPLHYLEDSERVASARHQWRECTVSVLLKRLGAPAVCLVNQGAEALYQALRISGIVVNIGFKHTTIVPMIDGQMLPGACGVETLPVAAMRVTGCLHHRMEHSGIFCQNICTIRALKEMLCSVSPTPLASLLPSDGPQSCATYDVPREMGGGSYTLGPERFVAPEVLFNPGLFDLPSQSLQEGVCSSINKCHQLLKSVTSNSNPPVGSLAASVQGTSGAAGTGRRGELRHNQGSITAPDLESAMKHVVLCGGTSALPGLAERLELELKKRLPKDLAQGLTVHKNAHGYNAPWMGGKMVAEMSNFPESWCITRDQFMKEGSCSVKDVAVDVRIKLRR